MMELYDESSSLTNGGNLREHFLNTLCWISYTTMRSVGTALLHRFDGGFDPPKTMMYCSDGDTSSATAVERSNCIPNVLQSRLWIWGLAHCSFSKQYENTTFSTDDGPSSVSIS